jgi:hypothetical protein
MTTITLEVPDELAAQLNALPESLPELIREAVAARVAQRERASGGSATGQPLYQELIDFLTSDPDADRVIAFKISPVAQERLEDLLDKNRDLALTPEEKSELDIYLHLSHLVTRMKARARGGQPLLN